MSIELDTGIYAQIPKYDVAGGTALADSLHTAVPKGLPAAVKRAADKMKSTSDALRLAWRGELVTSTGSERRAADNAIDRAWGAFHARLEACASLPVEHHPQAARATELVGRLFPGGLSFLQLPFVKEWSESQQRLELIDAEDLTKPIKDLIGIEYLDNIRRAHEHYGRVLGITQVNATLEPFRAAKLSELRRAMSTYVFNVLAQVDDDEAVMSMVRQALKPIDDFRAGVRRGNGAVDGSAPAPDGTPIAPVAPVAPVAPTPPAAVTVTVIPNGSPS